MSKAAVGLLVALVVGNVVIILLFLGDGDAGPAGRAPAVGGDAGAGALVDIVEGLRDDVRRLAASAAARPDPAAAPAAGEPDREAALAAAGGADLATRLDDVVERLDRLEKTLLAMKEVGDEVAFAELRAKRLEQFRADDGFTVADELLSQKQYAVGANGILTFLEAHPDHPDARDLMAKARDAFVEAGYGDKALWLQDEIMKRFPEHRGADLYSRALLENKLRKLDDAIGHITESVELAATEQHRMNRMFYRAYLLHKRDGDGVGLEAYREVERLSRAAGLANPGDEAAKRAAEIEGRIAGR